ncbi:hypothetical protein EON67_02415 [archaeon]|nr:MAG: hypothetical protein EON67_02415 [archaeon]
MQNLTLPARCACARAFVGHAESTQFYQTNCSNQINWQGPPFFMGVQLVRVAAECTRLCLSACL